jgi:galactokinase
MNKTKPHEANSPKTGIDPRALAAEFEQLYGAKPRLFRAPGRVNLIGEHTDYNDGFVLPMAIEFGVTIAAAPRKDNRIRIHSRTMGASGELDLDAKPTPMRGVWLDYIEGTARELLAAKATVRGADLLLDSDLPLGAGLSSSAALEIGVGLALLACAGEDPAKVDRPRLARAAQAAEHHYVGTRCGIMDQMIVALGQTGRALLLDCRSLETTLVPLPDRDTAIVICDSGVKHELASSAYNERRAQCEQGVRRLQRDAPHIRALRDATLADLDRVAADLGSTVHQRCRHVVSENLRTTAAAEALKEGELTKMGELMAASHRSLRDDYEVSCVELDFLVDTASSVAGVLGARMTGGGFGGSTVNLVRRDSIAAMQEKVTAAYTARFGRAPRISVSQACAGAHEIT